MHMNQMYFSALNRGRGNLKKYAIVQQMQMFKKEIQGTRGTTYIESKNSEEEKYNDKF